MQVWMKISVVAGMLVGAAMAMPARAEGPAVAPAEKCMVVQGFGEVNWPTGCATIFVERNPMLPADFGARMSDSFTPPPPPVNLS